MVTKKKSISIFFILFWVVLFVICLELLLSNNCYAMTTNEVDYALNYLKDNLSSTNSSYTAVQNYFTSTRNEKFLTYLQNQDISSYNLLTITYINGSRMVYDFYNFDNSLYYLKFFTSGQGYKFIAIYSKATNAIVRIDRKQYNHYTYSSNLSDIGNTTNTTDTLNSMSGVYFYLFTPEIEILNQNGEVATQQQIQNFIGYQYLSTTYNPSSISMTATSNHKFGFTSRNQLFVEFTGDWTTSDFSFYIQRYENLTWNTVTKYNDYNILTGYDNPFYIFWADINYLPVGTYRYMADYGSLGTDFYYSNTFEITSSVIENSGTGTVDSNGNIDINTDTGATVDNIKDFFGAPADFDNALKKDDIDKALDLDYIDNPYENFILSFFNGLVSSFTDNASDLVFKVHTWGEVRTVSPSDFAPNYNSDIRTFLTIISSIVWCFVIVKWCTKIIDSITHMSLQDCVDLIDAHYSNLF